MTKDAAMSVLGLKLTTEGKNKKALKLTDYSEDELLIAFRETCAVIGRPILTFFDVQFFFNKTTKKKKTRTSRKLRLMKPIKFSLEY